MVRLTRIYTKTGDDGSTGLADGSRRDKDDGRLRAYGDVDELNASLGVVVEILRQSSSSTSTAGAQLCQHLLRIQNDLFDLGADLATPGEGEALRVVAGQVSWLEECIDAYNEGLPALESFVLPGGSPLAAAFHMSRTICRRAEREVVSLARQEAIGPHVLPYLNRLSDLCFVLARVANRFGPDASGEDVLWVPGASR